MDIFQEYKEGMETYIESFLKEIISGFSMEAYAVLISERKDEIDDQLLELITSFTDFNIFKDLMISFRKMVIATTPKHKSAKAAELEKEMLDQQNISVPEGLELLHISGNKTKVYG